MTTILLPTIALRLQPIKCIDAISSTTKNTAITSLLLLSFPFIAFADTSAFEGTFSDPNHFGGKRVIKMLDTKIGNYQLAEVRGGGGRGEPKDYILPAMIVGPDDKSIIIDFTPKGIGGCVSCQIYYYYFTFL